MEKLIKHHLDTNCKTVFEKVDMQFILTYLKRFEPKLVKNKKQGEAVTGKHINSKNVRTDAK
jgi:hypothetical protein